MEKIIYHITEKAYFESQIASGFYISPTFHEEKFIHLSTINQIESTLERYYKGCKGLVILQIAEKEISENLKYEKATNGQYFPHVYGPIPQKAILIVEEI